jgi:hypothetical protein
MTVRVLALLLVVLAVPAAVCSAQTVSFRLGPGVAYAERSGWSGLAAVEVRERALVVRASGHLLYVPHGVAEAGFAGVFVGVSPSVRSSAVRPYFLATLSRGVDFREADALTTVGVAAGVDALGSPLFAEIGYANSLQRAHPLHYTLPEHQVMLCAGLRLGRSPAAGNAGPAGGEGR